jgi:hypothetical protein
MSRPTYKKPVLAVAFNSGCAQAEHLPWQTTVGRLVQTRTPSVFTVRTFCLHIRQILLMGIATSPMTARKPWRTWRSCGPREHDWSLRSGHVSILGEVHWSNRHHTVSLVSTQPTDGLPVGFDEQSASIYFAPHVLCTRQPRICIMSRLCDVIVVHVVP